jgi:homoserine O-succinyltransferase/O-acetyltransferase
MPVSLELEASHSELRSWTNGSRQTMPGRVPLSDPRCLQIGLLNNMPDGALRATVRQFVALLKAAADGLLVRLSLYTLPDVPRSEQLRRHVEASYSSISNLWDRRLDGFIITGAEPRAALLKDEPYWQSLVKVLEWADFNTRSTILSCLSAHAAVLHFDGVERRRLESKRFGVFPCSRVIDHPLMSGTPRQYRMPQSRWNEIPEDELTASGYLSLARLSGGGVDTFIKQRTSTFLFFQGHPEYEANTLCLEYRRDIVRYLSGEAGDYPSIPIGYFDQEMADALTSFQARARRDRRMELLAELPALQLRTTRTSHWRPAAVRMYSNWLADLYSRKERRPAQRQARLKAMNAGALQPRS